MLFSQLRKQGRQAQTYLRHTRDSTSSELVDEGEGLLLGVGGHGGG